MEGTNQALLLSVSATFFSSSNKKFTFQICICHFSSTAEKSMYLLKATYELKLSWALCLDTQINFAFLRISITICSHYKEKTWFFNTCYCYAVPETVISIQQISE